MHLTLQLFGATIVDLHIRDDDLEDEDQPDLDLPQFGYGMGTPAHTELVVEPE
ncbi:MAG TPA: hypothetical protein VNM48_09880 [Chloroflexota bacterium]|nr:hypothetical protein [Chloroflexota bacterium]